MILKGARTPEAESIPERPAFPYKGPHEEFLDQEIRSMLEQGVISPYNGDRPVCHPIFATCKPGDTKLRFVLDARWTNRFHKPDKFKTEGIKQARRLAQKGHYMAKIDLSSAFYHVKLHERTRRLLCFEWKGTIYCFNVLPFGWADSPVQYHKVIYVAIRELRKRGVSINHYVDDLLLAAPTKKQLRAMVAQTVSLLEKLGFTINLKKSILEPTQSIVYIGYLINTKEDIITLPEKRIKALTAMARRVINNDRAQTLTNRTLARWTGTLAAICEVFPQADFRKNSASWILTRSLEMSQGDFNAKTTLDKWAITDINFWLTPRADAALKMRLTIPPIDVVQTSDASGSGWAGQVSVNGKVVKETHGHWSANEGERPSNQTELEGISNVYFSLTRQMRPKHILIQGDNTTALKYASRYGGKVRHLDKLIKPMARSLLRHGTIVSKEHIPGLENPADEGSRRAKRLADFMLPQAEFLKLLKMWGPFELDLFATRLSAKLPKFVSRYPDPKAWRVNALALDWSKLPGTLYAFPPFNLIHAVLTKVEISSCPMVLVVPDHPGASYAPQLRRLAQNFPPIVLGEVLLQAADRDKSDRYSRHARLVAYFLNSQKAL